MLGLGFGTWKKIYRTKKLRQKLINGLRTYAEGIVEEGKSQATQFIDNYQGETSKIVSRLITEQDEKRQLLEERLISGDLRENQVKVSLLRDYHDQLTSLQKSIEEFFVYVRQSATK